MPQFFDQSYDLNRVISASEGIKLLLAQDMAIFEGYDNDWTSSGVYGSASMNLFDLVKFNASYASMTADTIEYNSFNTVINVTRITFLN